MLSDVLETWKYFLRDKLGLSCDDMEAPVHYADIRKAYDTFLKSSNLLDLIEICQKCHMLIPESEEIPPVSVSFLISRMV